MTETHQLSINKFWNELKQSWSELYPRLLTADKNALYIINNYLGELSTYIEIEASYNEINKQALSAYDKHIVLHITPKLCRDNINIMKATYNARITLNNCSIACYHAYNPNDQLIADIEYKELDLLIKYDDFGFQGSFGYDDITRNPILNIVIVIKQPLASKIIKKQVVNFKTPDGKISNREVWMPTDCNPVDLLLLNIIGEYNLLNHVGYIELMPEDDPLITKGSIFTELIDIRKNMEIILKHYHYKSCNYCQQLELQMVLFSCSKCKKVNYCGKICQAADWKMHKLICNN
jgi:hypothetical protein